MYIFISIVIILLFISIYKIYEININKKEDDSITYAQEKEYIIDTITLGISKYDTINPILSLNKQAQQVSKIIFEPLINVEYNYKLSPCLATEWSKINNTTYIIKLRENVLWHDNSKFTSKDIKYTIDKIKEKNSIYVSNINNIETLEIIDDYTIRIILKQETPFFEYNLTFPIIKDELYIGTGKYKLESSNNSKLILTENTNWWNKQGEFNLKKVEINLYDNSSKLYNDFKLEEIDLISTSNFKTDEYIGKIGFNRNEYIGREYDFIAINTEEDLLKNKEIRQAIKCGISKEEIIFEVYNNTYFASEFPLDYGNYLYDKGNEVLVNYNVKNILNEAGWKFDGNIWRKNEQKKSLKTEISLMVNSQNEFQVQVAEKIKQQLENEGLKINILKVAENVYDNNVRNRNYEIALIGINASFNPNLYIFFGDNNLSNYKNESIDELLEEIINTNDENTVKERIREIANIYLEEVPYISLYYNRNLVAYNKNLVAEITPNWYNIFYNIENWYIKEEKIN